MLCHYLQSFMNKLSSQDFHLNKFEFLIATVLAIVAHTTCGSKSYPSLIRFCEQILKGKGKPKHT